MVRRLFAGGSEIRTLGPAVKETAVERGPRPTTVVAGDDLCLMTIQLIAPASPFGNSGETLLRERYRRFESGFLQRRVVQTVGSSPVEPREHRGDRSWNHSEPMSTRRAASMSPVVVRPGKGSLSEPTAATQPWPRAARPHASGAKLI
jgi:hypothetical protein